MIHSNYLFFMILKWAGRVKKYMVRIVLQWRLIFLLLCHEIKNKMGKKKDNFE